MGTTFTNLQVRTGNQEFPDIFEMRLMKDGKTEASYQTGPGMLLVKKGPAFIKALGLAGKEASAFRYLLKRETSA